MSNNEVLYSNELIIRFDQDEQGHVTWHLLPDEKVGKAVAANTNMEDLAELGAPLCALGIRALYDLFAEEFIDHALEKANIYLWKEYLKRQLKQTTPSSKYEGQSILIH